MAQQPLTLRKIYVVDTSYLMELFKVDGHYTDTAAEEIKNRFIQAEKAGDFMFVPLPCIYELGNHIADVRNGSRRRELALSVIEKCINKNCPWTITPASGTKDISELRKSLSDLWDKFAKKYIKHTKHKGGSSLGLVDSEVILEAERLKEEYKSRISKVHIWTRDKTLKNNEPDKEPNPFVN